MTINDEADLAALADGTLSGPEWEAWLAAHPRAAAEVAIARRVRTLIARLRAEDIALPTDLERLVLARVHANTTFLDILELSLAGVGRALLEVLEIFFGMLPAPRSAPE
jgi:anti-sigma factor RsiW